MKRILLPLLALSIAFISCNRDNDDITNPIENPVEQGNLLADITEEGRILSQFIYDGDKIKSSGFVDGNNSYSYTGNQITAIHREKGTFGTWDIRYTYNSDGTLHSAFSTHIYERPVGYDNNNDIIMGKYKEIATREYTYTNNNTINVKETYDDYIIKNNTDEKVDSNIAEYIFVMNNGNIISKTKKQQNIYSGATTTTYTYDNKMNPLNNIKGFSALSIEFHLIEEHIGAIHLHGNKNNILTEKYSTVDSRGVEINSYQNISEYEYNSKGYPTKQTSVSSGAGREDITTISHYNYK